MPVVPTILLNANPKIQYLPEGKYLALAQYCLPAMRTRIPRSSPHSPTMFKVSQ
jgi:hypothetical protein